MRKKASLNLSINAIVVLILAITMLGLGLTFMKTMFGKVTDQFSEISSELETEIIKKLEASSSRLEFTNTQLTMKRGEEKTVYFGIYNNLNADCTFGITGTNGADYPLTDSIFCDEALGEGTGDDNSFSLPSDVEYDYQFSTISLDTYGSKDIEINKAKIFPLVINIDSNAVPDTYSCHLLIPSGIIEDVTSGGTDCDITDAYYARKDFFIIVE